MLGIARLLDRLGEAVQLVLVERVVGQALHALAELGGVDRQLAALGAEVGGRRGQPGKLGEERVAHGPMASSTIIDATCAGVWNGALSRCMARKRSSKA